MVFPIVRSSYLICAVVGGVIGITVQVLLFPLPPGGTPDGDAGPGLGKVRKMLTGLIPGMSSERNPGDPIGDVDYLALMEPAADEATIDAYLERHQFSRESMLAAALMSEDPARLIAAARRYPDDPYFQLLVIAGDALPEERREWLERFKASQPDNLLSSLFLGGDLLADGEVEAGLAELHVSANSEGHEDFSNEGGLVLEAALIELGHPPLEAKMRSNGAISSRHLQRIQQEMKHLRKLADEAGSPEEKTELASLGAKVGYRMHHGGTSANRITQLVGFAQQNVFSRMLDPDTAIAGIDKTPTQLREEFEAEKARIISDSELSERTGELTEQQVVHLIDRRRVFGDENANNWLREQLDAPYEPEVQP